jgi:acetyl-CoA carboxylase biotin carboxyl carrier protein
MKNRKKSSPGELGGAPIELGEIERLLGFMSQHGLEEFEYARGDLRIRLKKHFPNSNSFAGRHLPAPEIVIGPSGPAPLPAEGSAPAAPSAPPAAEPSATEDVHLIKSPIVGTYYESPNPGAEPFVKVGDRVEVGQVLCIIEAMKLMNEIESDVSGEVMRLHMENGQPVEYGEVLFTIRPSRRK